MDFFIDERDIDEKDERKYSYSSILLKYSVRQSSKSGEKGEFYHLFEWSKPQNLLYIR